MRLLALPLLLLLMACCALGCRTLDDDAPPAPLPNVGPSVGPEADAHDELADAHDDAPVWQIPSEVPS